MITFWYQSKFNAGVKSTTWDSNRNYLTSYLGERISIFDVSTLTSRHKATTEFQLLLKIFMENGDDVNLLSAHGHEAGTA